MSNEIPIVRFGPPISRSVRFDFDTFDRIERGCEMGIGELAKTINSFAPLPASELAKPQGERREPTAQEAEEAGKRVRIGLVARFVAACLGIPLAELAETVPPNQLLPLFGDLTAGFSQGVEGISGKDPHPSDGGTA